MDVGKRSPDIREKSAFTDARVLSQIDRVESKSCRVVKCIFCQVPSQKHLTDRSDMLTQPLHMLKVNLGERPDYLWITLCLGELKANTATLWFEKLAKRGTGNNIDAKLMS